MRRRIASPPTGAAETATVASATAAHRVSVAVDERDAVDLDLIPAKRRDDDGACVVLAHGAGGDMHQPLLVHLQEVLADNGHAAARFNFPYAQRGRRAPDATPRLLATWRAVLSYLGVRLQPRRLVLGGKSMGGRMASMLVAEGQHADGLLLLGYPLHPAGKTERLRDTHFDAIGCRCLFVQGARDRLCEPALLRRSLTRLRGEATLYEVAEADHSFAVPKRAGVTAAEVQAGIDAAVLDWLRAC